MIKTSLVLNLNSYEILDICVYIETYRSERCVGLWAQIETILFQKKCLKISFSFLKSSYRPIQGKWNTVDT